MKSTGMVRNVDTLGRIVIPKELRGTLNISNSDPLEVFIDENEIILKKYNPGCLICGDMGEFVYIKEQKACKNCIDELKSL